MKTDFSFERIAFLSWGQLLQYIMFIDNHDRIDQIAMLCSQPATWPRVGLLEALSLEIRWHIQELCTTGE